MQIEIENPNSPFFADTFIQRVFEVGVDEVL
jgi:hypothetical protein